MDVEISDRRNALFRELKPHCIQLSQLALQNDKSPASTITLRAALHSLLDVLQHQCRRLDTAFDDKLADYVFFPLSSFFKRSQAFPAWVTELCLKCLVIVLEYGWKDGINPDLAKQLLLLLTLFAGGVPGKSSSSVPEELQLEAYRALGALFRDVTSTPKGPSALRDNANLPTLGHTVSVLLDGVVDGPSLEVQTCALVAFEEAWICIKDRNLLATFLPGSVTALTKVLTPTTKVHRSRKVLVLGLRVLAKVLTSTVGDIWTRNLSNDGLQSTDRSSSSMALDTAWLKATAGQVKLSLANVTRLRSYGHDAVRNSLSAFCITLLDECNKSLADSAAMLVEVSMSISSSEPSQDRGVRPTGLADLAIIYPEISELVKTTIYKWITNLPTVMQSSDESYKRDALRQLASAYELASNIDFSSKTLDDALIKSLQNSVALLMNQSNTKTLSEVESNELTSSSLTLSDTARKSRTFQPVLLDLQSQRETREAVLSLLQSVKGSQSQAEIASEMLGFAQESFGSNLVSAFWLAFHLVKSATSDSADLEMFLDQSAISDDGVEDVVQELFSLAITTLSDSASDPEQADWRSQAIALEAVAFTAERLGEAFRPDMIDALYPVVELIGSPNPKLKEHAITCLNLMSTSSGYSDVGELIVENSDYMVNAISLKLNTFDISPQAPQILIMMIRLSEGSLLPYLDDVVGSIFTALDNFHGYPRLVEALFAVLSEIVDEGGRSETLQITSGANISHQKLPATGTSIEDIIEALRKADNRNEKTENESFEVPQEPWKGAKALLDESTPRDNNDNDDNDNEAENNDDTSSANAGEPPGPAPTKIYTMIQSIAKLAQHYLTSASAPLRRSLLLLVATASRALHRDEERFLPLVNEVWPVVARRLHDDEPMVVAAACAALCELCRCAGDFLATRVRVEWAQVLRLARTLRARDAAESSRSDGGRGTYSKNRQSWEALLAMLLAVVEYVHVDDEMFDEVLDVLDALLLQREDVRRVMAAVNADAVWLKVQLLSRSDRTQAPVLEGYTFVEII